MTKSMKFYELGDLTRSIEKNKSTDEVKKSSSTTYLKLAQLFSSPADAPPPLSTPLPLHIQQPISSSSSSIKRSKNKKLGKKVKASSTEFETEDNEKQLNDDEGQVDEEKQESYHLKPNPEEERRTIFVGNLPNTLTRKRLGKIFKNSGPIESIRIRSVARNDPKLRRKLATIRRDFHPDVNNMNAYIRFKTESGAKSALTMNGEVVDGFHLRVDMAEGDKQPDYKKSVFLGNLSFKIEEEKVRLHFEDCGEIVSVRLIRDKMTRMGKGFGYVHFKDCHGVDLALKLNNSQLEGRAVRVSRCERMDKTAKVNTSQDKKGKKFNKDESMKKGSRLQARRRIMAKRNRQKSKQSHKNSKPN